VLSSWQATVRVHPVHVMNVELCQVAADPQTHTPWRVEHWVHLGGSLVT